MNKLIGGYYIDEINKILSKYSNQETIRLFYEKNIGFELLNIKDYIDFENVNPLLKVIWNIIGRGDSTKASIKISDYILRKYFYNEYKGYSTNSEEIKFVLDIEFDCEQIKYLLDYFQDYEEPAFSEIDYKIYLLYKCLKELILINQIQKSIVILLMMGYQNSFNIVGIDNKIKKIAIEDLNDLIDAINDLTDNDETKISKLEASSDNNINKISINNDIDNAIILKQSKEVSKVAFNHVLTDRIVKYRKLGDVREEEIDGKYKQHFEYVTTKQKNGLLYLLNNIFRKSKFRAGQEAIINRALIGMDVIGLLPTGGGKSLTFQICALLQPGVTIVVDPINSLMKDQFDKLIENGISKTTFINSFNTKDEREANTNKLINGEVHIIFVSPERFQIEKFRTSLQNCKNQNVFFSYAVIDEAHCVSEWGHDFRHVYLNLAQNLKRFCSSKDRNISVFGLTATASFDVLADVQRELDLKEDAIISLPAEAIDRKELNFNIIPITCEIDKNLEFWDRERLMGSFKYPKLRDFLSSLPQKIKVFEKNYGYLNPNDSFYNVENGEYKNAGVIFCPTKSNKLPNGVLSVREGLTNLDFLKITTFFGGGSEDSIKDENIETEAELSVKNQESFLRNESNLMIATKAFGMGIDKSNIRYTIHYSFPNSVESFYQEAGRAGRDGNPSICSILYHPDDIYTNYDFYKNAFKGIKRERSIINELLEEVQYEDGFFLNVVTKIVKDKYPIVDKISLWNNRYLNVFGTYGKNIRIGKLDLNHSDLENYDDWRENIEKNEADKIIDYIRETIKKESDYTDILRWLHKKSSDGIKSLIDSGQSQTYKLKIGFTNSIISKMNEVIKKAGYDDFEEVIIRAGYDFSTDENDFLDNLSYHYYRFQINKYGIEQRTFKPNDATIALIKENYPRIRNSADTKRAIYRMNIVGIIDDYVIDYVGGFIEVRFMNKTEKEYTTNFKNYLRRYLGIETTEKWLSKVNEINEDSILKRVLYVLIDFIESEISDKRKRSIDYMQELCGVFLSNGEQEFRERMIKYFTSKYARADYLPKDTDSGRVENCEIVKKYINYIFYPPDGLGGQIDNAKHLRGACDNLKISMNENASIDLLTAFSLFALELKAEDTLEIANEKPFVKEAIDLYRNGFRRLLKNEKWEDVQALIDLFNKKVLDFNKPIKQLMDSLYAELLVNRTSFKLKILLDKIS